MFTICAIISCSLFCVTFFFLTKQHFLETPTDVVKSRIRNGKVQIRKTYLVYRQISTWPPANPSHFLSTLFQMSMVNLSSDKTGRHYSNRGGQAWTRDATNMIRFEFSWKFWQSFIFVAAKVWHYSNTNRLNIQIFVKIFSS